MATYFDVGPRDQNTCEMMNIWKKISDLNKAGLKKDDLINETKKYDVVYKCLNESETPSTARVDTYKSGVKWYLQKLKNKLKSLYNVEWVSPANEVNINDKVYGKGKYPKKMKNCMTSEDDVIYECYGMGKERTQAVEKEKCVSTKSIKQRGHEAYGEACGMQGLQGAKEKTLQTENASQNIDYVLDTSKHKQSFKKKNIFLKNGGNGKKKERRKVKERIEH